MTQKLSGLLLAAALLTIPATPRARAAADVVSLGGGVRADGQGALVTIVVHVAPGYHVNAHEPREPYLVPTALRLEAPGAELSEPAYPPPEERRFPFAAEPMLVYSGRFEITARAASMPKGPVTAALRYQACDDRHCLPPRTVRVALAPPAAVSGPASGPDTTAAAAGSAAPRGASAPLDGQSSRLLGWLRAASLPAALAMTLLLGLTLNLTPCVYPLISVTLGYFGSQADERTRPAPLAAAYVAGITLTFAALGVTAALAGGLFGAPLQHPAVPIVLAAVLVALALSSFGLYEIRAPHSWTGRFGASSAGIGGAFLMGLTMGIIAAPCIGPVVLGLLVYVGAEHDVTRGFLLFLALGLGMGLPYLALASAAGSIARLPRAGEWLRWINRFFGVLLLAMALYLLSPLLGEATLRVVVPVFVAAAGVYLGFLEPSARGLRAFTLARRALGTGAVVAALWLAIPSQGASRGIRWQPLSLPALERAAASGRPAVVEFGADWCLPCREMERSTFVHPEVTRAAARFAMLHADVTRSSAENDALLDRFGVVGVPTIIVYDAQGREVDRAVGFVPPERFLAMLSRAAASGSTRGST